MSNTSIILNETNEAAENAVYLRKNGQIETRKHLEMGVEQITIDLPSNERLSQNPRYIHEPF